MDSLTATIKADVEAISQIPIVSSLLEVVCRTTGMGFAAIARVTDDSWVACGVRDEIDFGLKPGGELKLETTICHEIRQNHKAVIIDHVAEDLHFSQHHTPALYGFQSYISVPIFRKNGGFFGTLCAIDPKPAKINTPQIIGMFTLFADLIAFHLNAWEEMALAETKLKEEREIAELREQFIAILGHDLRNPVGAIRNSAELLSQMPLENVEQRIVQIIKNSAFRVSGLIDNILDFASGRLGGGLTLNSKHHESLEVILNQIITELGTIWSQRTIKTNFELTQPINCDGNRIAQLFSNLLGNALSHSPAGTPVSVDAESANGIFKLKITNEGNPIPEAALSRLFQPFFRGEEKSGKQGLGLGLYIAAEIARAHGGALAVESTKAATSFTLTMPNKCIENEM